MVAHEDFYRRDAETQRFGDSLLPTKQLLFITLRLCVSAVILFSISCGSQPTDPRTVIPADSLVYLESRDLGRTLAAITENPNFRQLAKKDPDLSAVQGVKLAVAITGFETTEQKVTEENSVLNFQPRYVAVIETNAWSWAASKFVEDSLGEFFNQAYGGAVELEITTRKDGEFYVWTSAEDRKAYALQQGSLVFFGNDELAIERCQAVKRGEAPAMTTNANLATGDSQAIANGYVSTEGVAQIANIAGVSFAIGASEEDEVKSFVARVLPEILRNSLKDLTWTATRTDTGIEDKFNIELDEESSRVFDETLVPSPSTDPGLSGYIPASAATATRYLLRDPQLAWRSVLLTAQKKTDETSGALIGAFSSSFFEPYGIEEPEMFLSSIGSNIFTAHLTTDGEDAIVIATVKDVTKVKGSLAEEFNLARAPESQFGAELWRSEDGEIAAAFQGDALIAGDAAAVLKALEAKQAGAANHLVRELLSSDAAATTAGSAPGSADKLVGLLAEPKGRSQSTILSYRTETRFNRKGIERRTVSDFGLLGWIVEKLAGE